MKNKLQIILGDVLKDMNVSADFIVETPADLSHGEYSTNVALALSKELNESPSSIADTIIEKISQKDLKEFSKIEKAGPGFINFYLTEEEIQNKIKNPVFETNILNGQKILLEFTDPNPFKQFHIGHMMSNSIGESLSRIFEANGADVKRVCYQGDVGPHVAKAIWGMIQHKAFFPQDQDSLDDKAKFLGDSYVFGSNEYEENKKAQKEIKEINKELFENPGIDLQTYYSKGKRWSLEYFDKMYEILGTKFDKFYFETESAPIGKSTVEENIGKVFEKSDGAVVYKGEDEGLHTRVFINSQGLPTYEAKEIGLFYLKTKDFDFDRSITLTGNEQDQYFKVVFAAMNKINPEIVSKSEQMSHGMLRFSEGKMSSRKGNVLTAEGLITQVKDLVAEKIKDRDLSFEEKEDIKKTVSIGALKYSILKQSIGKDIVFDFEKSLSFEGDSGPYLQYAYTRAKSILNKVPQLSSGQTSKDVWTTTDLEKLLIQFEDILEKSLSDLAPQHLVTYLTKVASEFNSFYANTRILDEDTDNRKYKIQITKTVKETLEKGVEILGIALPEKM
jgi:arginyl-tRNA synthetase